MVKRRSTKEVSLLNFKGYLRGLPSPMHRIHALQNARDASRHEGIEKYARATLLKVGRSKNKGRLLRNL